MNLLQQLRFIDIKPGKSGSISHVIIWNPHWITRWHHAQKTPGLVEANFNALLDRALEIGAKDMIDEIPGLVIPAVSPTSPTPPTDAAAVARAVARMERSDIRG